MNRSRLFVLFAIPALLSGCLETREQQEEKQVMQKQVQSLQRMTADVSQRFTDIDEDIRKTNGRVEVAESLVQRVDQKVDRNAVATEAKVRELQEKIVLLRESVAKLEQGMAEANAQIAAMHEAQKRAPTPAASASGKSNAFAVAEELFERKDWKGAIPEYERSRKQATSGKVWREATYKIGVCFQELGLADDAKAFYDELIGKSPASAEAKRAYGRLRGMNGAAKKK